MTPALRNVGRLAARRDNHWREDTAALDAAIVEAVTDGASLRQVAEAAGVSHEKVRQVALEAGLRAGWGKV
jgi:hypothetical protein